MKNFFVDIGGKFGKSWENVGKLENYGKSSKKFSKTSKKFRKLWKIWKTLGKRLKN
jgi:hypothetical protein